MTLGEALQAGRTRLAARDAEGAALDARVLLLAAAECDHAALIAHPDALLPGVAEARYATYLERRLDGEPVARILGQAEFWGLPFALNAATLIPRPDTETLVETALAAARGRSGLRICDLGTGTGAVAIALLTELKDARAVATDISEQALQAARCNAERLGVIDRIRFERVDFAQGPEGPFDIVVANPPYVESGAIAGLAVEVRAHDPRAALDGGPDGLDAYRAILGRAERLIDVGGFLALEIGVGQGESVAALCAKAKLESVGFVPDLGGRVRVVTASRVPPEAGGRTAKKALGKVRLSG
jgi:release factor glutamine methyltransferase